MRLVAKYRIADIVIVRRLHIIEKNNVFKLCGVAYNSVLPTIALPRIKAQWRT